MVSEKKVICVRVILGMCSNRICYHSEIHEPSDKCSWSCEGNDCYCVEIDYKGD